MTGYGYDVLTAANGHDALVMVAQRQPDAVVLDVQLGSEPNGLEVCRQIREFSSVPIIILSVKNDDRSKIAALDLGADDYLTKPFNMDELRARIQAVMRRTNADTMSAPPKTAIEV